MADATGWRLFGANGSPYSVKVRSYLRYKRIPHAWLVRNSAERMAEHQKYAKLPLVPTLVSPDGEALQDSTPMMEELEKRFPERSIHPPGLSKFVSELLEEFGDEWGNKWMMHLRWYSSSSALSSEVFARRAAAEFCSGSPDADAMTAMAKSFKERMLQRSFTVGSNASTAPIIEKSYMETLQLLERHLRHRPFLFGASPALADFGLSGQLLQCFGDVLAGELMRMHAPRVALWCEVMANPQPEGDFEEWTTLAPTLEPLIASQVNDQWSQAQLALNRLRALISLATRASADGNVAPRCQELIAVLQGCEVTLLKGMSTHEMSERSMADANTDGSSVFLESVLPKLLTSAEEDLSSDKDFGDDRNAEEEVRLRLMLQDLTNHNEALRREMQELNKQGESSSQGSKGTSEATSATDCDSSEVEASMLHEIAEMRLALMEAYQELARWQQEDPQASAVIAQHQGLYYKSTAGRRGRFAA